MKCHLCQKNNAEIIQKFDYDGIETKIGYCQSCLNEMAKFHTIPVNKNKLSLFSTNVFFKNKFPVKKDLIEIKNVKSRVIIELPISIKNLLFSDDDNSKLRNTQALIKRGFEFWKNEYEIAKKEMNEERMKLIEDILNKIKKLL
ncbi:hypothetical protein [Marinitoga sp. 1155]|uniref:hypothetical protein n=1 Tax=Marinitoga sp. 1155 TaxID=1428448 RepID=UPI00064143B3|nr:hypothetical protein [Marinitoga sp. 1155]KLO20886.1 hypothetical protein X274_11570 [Marinitoga sp. 1155]